MDIMQTVYAILNPAQIGIQAGQKVANKIAPTPQWILTPYAASRLQQTDPAAYNRLVSDFSRLQADTTAAYQQALNPVPALVNIGKYVLIAAVIFAVIYIVAKKGK